jgi:hypothetical protein
MGALVMRRLINFISTLTATLLVGVILTLCSLAAFAVHAGDAKGSSVLTTCNAACHSHGQHMAVNSQISEEDEEDEEPTPPAAGWLHAPVNLSLLYIMPIFALLWFVHNQKRILLTTQLRF